MQTRHGTKLALTGFIVALVTLAAGCGGGGTRPFVITITACDTTSFAGAGVICIEFDTSGLRVGQFDLLAQFAAGPGAPIETATGIPPALAAQLGVTSTSGPLTAQLKFPTSFRFCWFAGADLGFVPTAGIQFFLTPVFPGTTEGAGPTAGCMPFDYGGGGQTQGATGPGIGNLVGRAGHCAENVGGKSIAIAGGYTSPGAGSSVYDTVDRVTFDTTGFTYTTNASPLLMQNPRANHACSFFLDPATDVIKVLVAGGDPSLSGPSPTATADVYCFTPTEQVMPTTGPMNVARRGHTATWIPSNKVVIIGGVGVTGAALCSIEIWDPVVGTFQLLPAALAFCREGHTATLLPSGKILVAGGWDPTAAPAALPAELFDPVALTVMTVPGPLADRIKHTATRLANGWVLLAGGLVASNPTMVTSSAQIFEPELGAMGEFTSTAPLMSWPRAFHAASLLGDGHALLTGGLTVSVPCFVGTQTAELFLPETLTFTPTVSLTAARAFHTSTATSCGAVAIIGGTNDINCVTSFLSSVEIYPFENQNPVIVYASDVPPPSTGGGAASGTTDIYVQITDEDADGGYVIIRYRVGGVGMFQRATILGQGTLTPTMFPASMHVTGLPGVPVNHVFSWNSAMDGLVAGTLVEVEVLPVGATLGTPVRFTTTLP